MSKARTLASTVSTGAVLADGVVNASEVTGTLGITYTTTKTANYTAAANDGVLTNTTAGAFTVTLPASPANGAQVVVADAAGTWGTNNLTVARNGNNIADVAQDLVCDISGASVQFVYNSSGTATWEVYAQVGGNGGTVVTLDATQTLTNKTLTAPTIASANLTTALTLAGAAGTNGQVLTSAGSGLPSWTTPAGGFSAMQVFTSSGTFTIPSGKTTLKVTVVGGGAGGSLSSATGTDGNTSSVASGTQSITTISATGGTAGDTIAYGGTGGVGTNGDINFYGGSGGSGPSSPTEGASGNGGSSFMGGGGAGRGASTGSGRGGNNYGGGGGGGNNSSQGSTGGGGGGAAIKYLTSMTAGNTLTVTIGASAAGATNGTQSGGTGAQGVVVIEY